MGKFEELSGDWAGSEWQAQASLALEMGKLGTPEAEKFLAEVLRSDGNYWVRGFAALALSSAKSEEVVLLLAARLNRQAIFHCDDNEFVRGMCAQALGSNAELVKGMQEEKRGIVLGAVRGALEDEPMVVEKAIPALGKLGDRDSIPMMYRATQNKLVTMGGSVDLGPIALAMCEMGVTEAHALAAYVQILEASQDMELAEKVMGKVEGFLREAPDIDHKGKVSSAVRICKRKIGLAKLAKGAGESVMDSVLGRISKPSYVGERKLPQPSEQKVLRLKLKSG